MAPKDPMILLSWINTRLRDVYPDLNELCKAENLDRQAIEAALHAVDYEYDPDTRQFV